MVIETIFGDSIFPGSPVAKNMKHTDLLVEIFPIYELNLIVTLTNAELLKNISRETTRLEIIMFLG